MKKDILIKIGVAVSLVLVFLIIIFSVIESNKKEEKNELSDFSEARTVKKTQAYSKYYNGEIILEKENEYHENDAIYILTATTIYAKYILNEEDVKILKTDDLHLNLSLDSNLRYFNYQFNYYYVKVADIKRFEELFNTKDAEGLDWDIIVNPVIFKTFFTSSIENNFLNKNEYDNNNELMFVGLMQSLDYNKDYHLTLIDMDSNQELLNQPLTDEQISQLRRDNIRVEIDMANIVNLYENKPYKHQFKIVLLENDEEIFSKPFNLYVTSY
ncbi:hypothetical protein KHQ81_03720 [Mycoplasmatota bacterium]|nr:hypothetical protein KHQ81_03720 [Mycoplasmatota bacterium]